MGSLLRHVTFKTASFGFFCLFVAGVIFIYYPSEKNDKRASLSKVSHEDQPELLLDGKTVLEKGQLEPTQKCKDLDAIANMDWKEIKAEALANRQLEQKKDHLEAIENVFIYFREVKPTSEPKGNILFLHGRMFSSATWQDLGTLHYLACRGFRAVAIDLPGYGESKPADVGSVELMTKLMKILEMKQAIIVSPSMSGSFAIPLLKENPEVFKGYVPVAPVGTNKMTPEEYAKIQVPSLIIYGEQDKTLGLTSLESLKHLLVKEIVELKGAGHAAYLDKPLEFHQAFLNFCEKIFT